jgi:Tol biopolymer transport system component
MRLEGGEMYCYGVMMILLAGIAMAQGDDSAWTVVEAVDARDVTQRSAKWLDYHLSPDGETIAWYSERNLCLFTIANAQTDCYATPEWRYFHAWSPDCQYVLLSDSSPRFSSLWVFETSTGQFTRLAEEQPGLWRPLWHPIESTVYFLSYTFRDEERTYFLHRHALDTGEETVLNLTELFQEDFEGMVLAAVSPEGTQFLLHDEAWRAPGLWLADITQQRL